MVPKIQYLMAPHKLNTPKIPEIEAGEKEIHRSLSNDRGKLALSYHEAGHCLQFRKHGIETKYLGPAITHDCPTDTYFVRYGSVRVRYRDYLNLAAENPDAFLKMLVAGEVAEHVLMGTVDPEASESDLQDFLKHSHGRHVPGQTAYLILLWKQAREKYFRELSADLEQQRDIIHEAQRFRAEIFSETLESVKTQKEGIK